MAADIGARDRAVSKWWQRDTIPSEWWSSLLLTKTAKKEGLNSDLLTGLAARVSDEARA